MGNQQGRLAVFGQGQLSMRGTGKPLISVVIPCYNYGAFVGEAIASVLAQGYPHYELIVVDDGSTDDSAAVIERELGKGEGGAQRVAFVQQPNRGVSAALNAGLALAKGELIATFDADDVMPPGRLALQAEYLARHPEVGCLGGVAVRIDEQGSLLPKKDKDRQVQRYDFARALAKALVVGGNIAVYRREAMDRAGGYDPAIRIQDFQMTLKVAHAGYLVDILPEVVTLYRKHPGSLSSDYKAEFRFGLEVIEPYRNHPSYESGRARLVTKALRMAVVDDKSFAWSLFRQVPLRQWDRQLLKRLRYFLFKPSRVT
ncbi:glycosyltransferase family 2 protein [Stutzerimonas tarimensis]|uniref:Glycosyltransferase family 2 protein n=1 Tax=Stutzerimonas tarimensis TaxID=1507735 RepID=A0ABV7T655_9GAMM